MKHIVHFDSVMSEVNQENEKMMIDNIYDLIGKQKTEKIEDLFFAPLLPGENPDWAYEYKKVVFEGPLHIVYYTDGENEILDQLSIEEKEKLTLYTYSKNDFYECENQLLVVTDIEDNVLARYYVEQECGKCNPYLEGQIERAHEAVKQIGLDPNDDKVKIVVTNY
ncbi:hypothetical protein D3C76_11900 [compost metagenome]